MQRIRSTQSNVEKGTRTKSQRPSNPTKISATNSKKTF